MEEEEAEAAAVVVLQPWKIRRSKIRRLLIPF
jgi:hypothetical protein